MLSAGKLQNRCPRCRAQLLGLYEALLQPRAVATSRPLLRSHASVSASTGRVGRSGATILPLRSFSTSRASLQDPAQQQTQTTNASTANDIQQEEDAEAVVRQARQTFGNTLPPDYLSKEELRVYRRLYGDPLRETAPEDVGIPQYHASEGGIADPTPKHELFREGEDGGFEPVEYHQHEILIEAEAEATDSNEDVAAFAGALENTPGLSSSQMDYLHITANNKREYDALMKLQLDFQAASKRKQVEEARSEEVAAGKAREQDLYEQDVVSEDENEDARSFKSWPEVPSQIRRTHPHSLMGQFTTNPSTLHLPKVSLVEPISALLKRTDISHVRSAAERLFGGPGLPFSPVTPAFMNNLPQKPIQLEAGHHRMGEIEADTFLATVLPGVYASAMSSLVEIRKRLGADWLRGLLAREGGPRVLDAGGGGAALLAWQEVLQAEWDVLREKGEVQRREPPGKKTVVVGSESLRQRISKFLNDTTFLPRLPDYLHTATGDASGRILDSGNGPAPRKTFDVIIVSHMLMPLDKPYKRKDLIDNLWSMLSPEGGVLIVLEKGHPRGFEAVADVRARMLDEFILAPRPTVQQDETQEATGRQREPGMIVAPCTNHVKCPLYQNEGLSPGRKDFCHFNQRFIRPPFLQKVLGESHHNHDDVKFSFIAVRRGAQPDGYTPVEAVPTETGSALVAQPPTPISSIATFLQGKDASDRAFAGYQATEDGDSEVPHPLSLPRAIQPPLKRKGHVAIDVCTPTGTFERWMVTKSFDKQAYHDARKAQWGDLWALGAKSRIPRTVRLGRAGAEVDPGDGGVRSREAALARKRKPTVVEINVHRDRGNMITTTERVPGGGAPVRRRTKNGRIAKIDDVLKAAGFDDLPDPEHEADMEFIRTGKMPDQ